jgi:hypothetical protein
LTNIGAAHDAIKRCSTYAIPLIYLPLSIPALSMLRSLSEADFQHSP